MHHLVLIAGLLGAVPQPRRLLSTAMRPKLQQLLHHMLYTADNTFLSTHQYSDSTSNCRLMLYPVLAPRVPCYVQLQPLLLLHSAAVQSVDVSKALS
jgi:hypothetical protein